MSSRRILSLWFPRLGAERLLRQARGTIDAPFAVIRDAGGMQVLSSLNGEAEALGLVVGQGVRDAQAMCPGLVVRLQNPRAEAAYLQVLRRWGGKFSPWVAHHPPASLLLDLTGCAHLFGGEAGVLAQVSEECADLGLTVQAGLADTVGAAWALARYAGRRAAPQRSGDAIDQEAYATRSRAAKRRHWERGGPAPAGLGGLAGPGSVAGSDGVAGSVGVAGAAGVARGGGPASPDSLTRIGGTGAAGRIAPPGQTRQAIGPLPVAALRLDGDLVAELARLGLRRIDDLASQPRAALARRFGRALVQRLDQALGIEPEPVSPAPAAHHFAVRLTLPEPVGLESDLLAALDRLLPPLCDKLRGQGRGARRVALHCLRVDQTMESVEVGLARPTHEPARIRPLLAMKLSEIDAGFGIDVIRIEASQTEPVAPHQHQQTHRGPGDGTGTGIGGGTAGGAAAGTGAGTGLRATTGSTMGAVAGATTGAAPIHDLIGRLGARIGLDAITRRHPADSHIPEKGCLVLAAAWSEPVHDWPAPPVPRPLSLWPPEPVAAPETPTVPTAFRWRNRQLATLTAAGPERIAPEWWLDDPNWRSGVRDYWRVTCASGERLWLYYAHGGDTSAGWFCQGAFA